MTFLKVKAVAVAKTAATAIHQCYRHEYWFRFRLKPVFNVHLSNFPSYMQSEHPIPKRITTYIVTFGLLFCGNVIV